jgi:hypothetical protein
MIKEFFFWFFVLPFFQKKHKIKQSRDQDDLFINDEKTHEAKSPKQVHFRLGRDERMFLKSEKQQTLFEQISSRRNIKNDPIAAIHSMCHNIRQYNLAVD